MDDEGLPADALGPFRPPRPIQRELESFSLAFSSAARPEYELGDKILLPQSLLAELLQWNSADPMIFRITAQRSGRITHGGVIEFTAEEGRCYLPHWLMQNLALQEGDVVRLETASLPKARYVKLQPHLTEFTYMTNPRAVLETRLRHFTALTQGDEIAIEYNGKTYWVTVVSCEPAEAVCVTDTDVSVEFAPPRDLPPESMAGPSNDVATSAATDPGSIEFGTTSEVTPSATTSRSLWRRKNEKAPEGKLNGTKAPDTSTFSTLGETSNQRENYWDRLPGGRTLSGRQVLSPEFGKHAETGTRADAATQEPARSDAATAKKFVPFSGTGRTLR